MPSHTVQPHFHPGMTPANITDDIAMPLQDHNGMRIVIMGPKGAGKTTIARQLSKQLHIPAIELDEYLWNSNLTKVPGATLRKRIAAVIESREAWVIDGDCIEADFSVLTDIVWHKVSMAIWLDYSLPLVIWRLAHRTWRRLFLKEAMWQGNQEKGSAVLHRMLKGHAIVTYLSRRKLYPKFCSRPEYSKIPVLRLSSPRKAEKWLRILESTHIKESP